MLLTGHHKEHITCRKSCPNFSLSKYDRLTPQHLCLTNKKKLLLHCIFIFWMNSQNLRGWKTMGSHGKNNAILWNIKDKPTKIGGCMWIWIANKFAKFHAKRLNRSENIPKSFRGGYFFGTPCTCTTSTFKLDLQLIPTTHLPSLSPTVANVGNINVLKRFCWLSRTNTLDP